MSRSKGDSPVEALIAIGSNMGRRIDYLHGAVTALQALSEGPVRCSPVYETRPVGYAQQGDFLNMVMGVVTSLRPLDLLMHLSVVESSYGRERTIQNGPRTLDLDLLLYGTEYICFRTLQVPHPRMWERAFVMVPLAVLEPERKAPGGQTCAQVAGSLPDHEGVRYVGHFW